MGIDRAKIDNMVDPERPAHTILLANGLPIVENLRSLDELTERSFRFFAALPTIEGRHVLPSPDICDFGLKRFIKANAVRPTRD